MKKPFHITFLTALLICSVSSCIKEDRSECNPGALLKFDYSLNTKHTNLFEQEVGKVSVFVFDENGYYYDCFTDEGNHLTNNWQMFLPIPTGKYTTVTWGGNLNHYNIGETNSEETNFINRLEKGHTHIDDFMLHAEKDGEPLRKLDNLYHGQMDIVSVYSPTTATTVPLIKDTKKLTVTIKDKKVGQNMKNTIPQYNITCTGSNARYRADNSFGQKAKTVTYKPYNTYNRPGEAIAELNLLRLYIGRALRLHIKNQEGKTVFDKDLLEVIRSTGHYSTQEELDREDDYNVIINIDKNIIVSVTINGWIAVEILPDL